MMDKRNTRKAKTLQDIVRIRHLEKLTNQVANFSTVWSSAHVSQISNWLYLMRPNIIYQSSNSLSSLPLKQPSPLFFSQAVIINAFILFIAFFKNSIERHDTTEDFSSLIAKRYCNKPRFKWLSLPTFNRSNLSRFHLNCVVSQSIETSKKTWLRFIL